MVQIGTPGSASNKAGTASSSEAWQQFESQQASGAVAQADRLGAEAALRAAERFPGLPGLELWRCLEGLLGASGGVVLPRPSGVPG